MLKWISPSTTGTITIIIITIVQSVEDDEWETLALSDWGYYDWNQTKKGINIKLIFFELAKFLVHLSSAISAWGFINKIIVIKTLVNSAFWCSILKFIQIDWYYLVFTFCSQFYEPEALLRDAADGRIFIELLGNY